MRSNEHPRDRAGRDLRPEHDGRSPGNPAAGIAAIVDSVLPHHSSVENRVT
jgi:hypothetical protein